MQLSVQRDAIDGLVDEVVEVYHVGFNKAIHNYSQILANFADSKNQVPTLPAFWPPKQLTGDLQASVSCVGPQKTMLRFTPPFGRALGLASMHGQDFWLYNACPM